MGAFEEKIKNVNDEVLSSNIQFGVIFMNWGSVKWKVNNVFFDESD